MVQKNSLKVLSSILFMSAFYSANVGSSFYIYEPKLPDEVKKLRKF